MTREQAKQFLNTMGVEEPTDEQVSNMLNMLHSETKTAEDKANRYKADADKLIDLQKQLDEINSQNLSDVEKANKATEEALAQVSALQQTVKEMQLQKSLAEIGIIGDDATQLINEDGSLNTIKLGEIMTNREKLAVAGYQKQMLDDTPSPDGSKGDDDEPSITKDITERVKANKTKEAEAVSIIDSYK